MDRILTSPLPSSAVSRRACLRQRGERGRDPYDGLRPWSAITHGAGALLAVIGTALLLVRSLSAGRPEQAAVFAVYGASMILLYTASTLYHCVNTCVAGRMALRKLDHCSICLLIAGSYPPVCLLALKGWAGTALLIAIWGLALAGIALAIAWIMAPRWLTAGIYLFMGWMALFAIAPLSRVMPAAGMAWLIAGGGLYTVGGVLYALKWPGRNNPRFGCHEIFHVFILLGSVCHFMMMYQVIALL